MNPLRVSAAGASIRCLTCDAVAYAPFTMLTLTPLTVSQLEEWAIQHAHKTEGWSLDGCCPKCEARFSKDIDETNQQRQG